MNSTGSTASNSLEETDKLLHKFEIDYIPTQYREYYGTKRNNFFANIQAFPDMWQYYVRLDVIWLREIQDLNRVRDSNLMFEVDPKRWTILWPDYVNGRQRRR